MNVFELLLYITSGVVLLELIVFKKRHHYRYFSTITWTGVVFVLHTLFETVRWQLYPLYVALVLLFVLMVFALYTPDAKYQLFKRVATILSAVLVVVSIGSVLSFPVYDIPEPTGDYLIGTDSFTIEDQTRIELYGDAESIRRFNIQLWYPASEVEGYEQAKWLVDGVEVSRALSIDNGLPRFVLDHMSTIESNAYLNAPVDTSLGALPVVVISHGWRGFRNLHTDFAEALASEGYLVVSIDHTYGSVGTLFDDEMVYVNYDALPNRDSVPNFLEYANQLVYTYQGDILTTLDYLEAINDIDSSSRFSNTMDLSKIGLLGHSTGGGAGTAAALEDDRVKALFGLDSWVESIDETLISTGTSIPSVFLRSETWEVGLNNDNLTTYIENSTDATLYQIDGTTHLDFSMIYMISPLTNVIGFTGDIEGRYLNTIMTSMMIDFFDETLMNGTYTELDISEWEEVRFIIDETS
jgi:pimeloyl-ACP methyl ester carboxylesterase